MSNSPHSITPIYGNCKVLSPDGILMFRCDDKKANWYLKRNLAEIIESPTLVIRLKFQPRGLGNHGKPFGLTEMENKCVNCGSTNELNRHHVVPYCYRKFFPLNFKSHNFHDVLAMCVSCHEKYERIADKLKKELSIKYEAPINGEVSNNKDVIRYIKMSTTLLKDGKIPKSKINKLKDIIKKGLGILRLSKKKLEEISSTKSITVKRTHGEIVMSKVTDLQKFIEMWRTHFIENNKCDFLPSNWNIKNKL